MPFFDKELGAYRPSPGEVVDVHSPSVERQPEAGDVYEFTRMVKTIGGHVYERGGKFRILERTDEAPFGYRNPQGNFKVATPDGRISVWSSIHGMIADGALKLTAAPPNVLPRYDREDVL